MQDPDVLIALLALLTPTSVTLKMCPIVSFSHEYLHPYTTQQSRAVLCLDYTQMLSILEFPVTGYEGDRAKPSCPCATGKVHFEKVA